MGLTETAPGDWPHPPGARCKTSAFGPECFRRRPGRLGGLLTEFLDLAVHLLDLAFQELLLELDDFFRVLGPNELLREVEGGVDVLLGEVDRLAVDRPPPGLGRLDGRFHGAVQAVCLAHVLVDGLPGLGQRAFRLGRSATDRIARCWVIPKSRWVAWPSLLSWLA